MITVIVRGEKVFVSPRAGGLGVSWDVEPVFVVPCEKESIAKALAKAAAEGPAEGDPRYCKTNLRNYRSPVLQASGLRSHSEFERGAKRFSVLVKDADVIVERWKPDPKQRTGYVRDEAWSQVVNVSEFPGGVAQLIVEALPSTQRR